METKFLVLPESKESQSTTTQERLVGAFYFGCHSPQAENPHLPDLHGPFVLETEENEIKWVPSWLHPDFSFVSRLSALRTREKRNLENQSGISRELKCKVVFLRL